MSMRRGSWVIPLLAAFPVAVGAAPPHWVATFTNAQPLIPTPLPSDPPVPANLSHGFHDQTVRMIVHTSIGGSALRLRLTSPFGNPTVLIGAVHVALHRCIRPGCVRRTIPVITCIRMTPAMRPWRTHSICLSFGTEPSTMIRTES
jgi:hypothetical protein